MASTSADIAYAADWWDDLTLGKDIWLPFPTVVEQWRWSVSRLRILTSELAARLEALPGQDYCIALAGSFARMEACEASDLDFMVISREPLAAPDAKQIVEAVRQLATERDIALPNPDGAFSLHAVETYERLMDRVGSRDDTMEWLTQRMLLLMEARPIHNAGVFRDALRHIVATYLEEVTGGPHKDPVFLLNDAIRYFRTVCVNYQHKAWAEGDKWCLRNVKLRHSRVIIYAALVLTILNASQITDKHAYLLQALDLTPLQRIVRVYVDADDTGYRRILSAYDAFLRRVSDVETRGALQVDYSDRYMSSVYRDMRVSAMAITAELLRFVMAQRERWGETILEYLLF